MDGFKSGMENHEPPTVYSTYNNSHQRGKTLKIYPNFLGWKLSIHFLDNFFSDKNRLHDTSSQLFSEFRGKNLKGRSFSGPFPNHPDVSTTHVTNRLERFTNLRFKSYQMGFPLNTPSILVNYNT